MNEHREFYRKKLESTGCLILPSGEIPFRLRDLSIDGFQAHFDHVPSSVSTKSVVRIRLPSLDLEKIATVMRIASDPVGGYSVGFLFGKPAETSPDFAPVPGEQIPGKHREFYRKKLESTGYLMLPSGEISFHVKDLSIDGFQAHFEHAPSSLSTKAVFHIRLPTLGLESNATVMRIAADPEGGYSVGFLFEKSGGDRP